MKFLKPKFWDKNKVSLLSVLLFPFSLLVKLLFFLNILFTKKNTFSIPTICVGNIYIGGTGKTPLCIELFDTLKNLNKRAVFIRKKYTAFEDEVNLLKQNGPIYEGTTRAIAINKAIENKFEIAILDDGFQDFSIQKNLSILCFNEKQWVGNGFSIPSGPLREGLSALKRAHCVLINGKKNINIEKKILEKNKSIKIFYSSYIPQNISNFKNKKIICFAGIGNPNNFFELLKENKINVIENISFPDHYKYSDKDLENLVEKSKKEEAILLTTEKDYMRINSNYGEKISFLKIKLEIKNKSQLIEEIKKLYENF